MNLKRLIRYWLWRDTTEHSEYALLRKLIPPDCPKVVVDVGANDGFGASNSFPFIARGWRAVLIEPHPAAFARLRQRYAGNGNVTCLNLACADSAGRRPLYVGVDGDEGTLSTLCTDDTLHFRQARTNQTICVAVDTLDHLLERVGLAADFGILSIDTEGLDYAVLRGLDLARWRPRIVLTEDYQTNADKFRYLEAHHYQLRAQAGSNTIWSYRGVA